MLAENGLKKFSGERPVAWNINGGPKGDPIITWASPGPLGGNAKNLTPALSARNTFRFRGACAGAPWPPLGPKEGPRGPQEALKKDSGLVWGSFCVPCVILGPLRVHLGIILGQFGGKLGK